MSNHDLTGQALGESRVIKWIGGGGMAEIYLAKTQRRDLCALKVLLPHLQKQPDFVRRFLREAKNAALLRHPNIVAIHDCQQLTDGTTFFVMDWVEGGSLADLMAARRQQGRGFSSAEIGHIIGQVAEALEYAHQQGVIHRDVKPSNILLTMQGQVRLGDFGIAKIAQTTTITRPGEQLGTPAYMAPEQARGADVSPQTDVYALGVVVYEMLAGRPPFQGDTSQVLSILYQHVHKPPPPVRTFNPTVSPSVERVLSRVLAKKPEERYRSPREFVAAFRVASSRQPLWSVERLRTALPIILVIVGGLGLLGISLSFLWLFWGEPQTPTATVGSTLTQTTITTRIQDTETLSPTNRLTDTLSPRPTSKITDTLLNDEGREEIRPILLAPDDDTQFATNEAIPLRWSWQPLISNQAYVVTINYQGQTIRENVVASSPFTVSLTELGTYNWLVIVRQQDTLAEVTRSKRRRFIITSTTTTVDTPTTLPRRLAAPRLLEPPDGFGSPAYLDVTLRWDAAPLSAEGCYVVSINHRQGTDYIWLSQPTYTLGDAKRWLSDPNFGPNLTWQVVIAENQATTRCEVNQGTPTNRLSNWSQLRSLRWVE